MSSSQIYALSFCPPFRYFVLHLIFISADTEVAFWLTSIAVFYTIKLKWIPTENASRYS